MRPNTKQRLRPLDNADVGSATGGQGKIKLSVAEANACFEECKQLMASGDNVIVRTEAHVKVLIV